MEEKYPYFGEKMGTNFSGSPKLDGFGCIFPCFQDFPILWENLEYQFPRFSTYDGFCKIFPGTNFPGFSHLIGFPVFSEAMGNWWVNPCIFHMMKHTTGWESHGEKSPILWEKYEDQFPRLFPFDGFRWLF